MKATDRGIPKPAAKTKQNVRKDRRSATGVDGSVKKGGHGGKFTWSGDSLSQSEIGVKKEVVDVKHLANYIRTPKLGSSAFYQFLSTHNIVTVLTKTLPCLL
ncbi:hypothetical protein GIB67_042358 [Kingdonia uniflora]|uniref:Uncharacterized protein n=1 Tax=Kingdonia uniflora TaxID=39325 RepID=A0A7J7LUJ0_9MAGN|nr:hypothetical protein GIB67_042358 [Kingdonia uniflora]